MTAVFWVVFVMYLVKTVGFVFLYRSHQRLAAMNLDLARDLDWYDEKLAEYRAEFRDVVIENDSLHTTLDMLESDDQIIDMEVHHIDLDSDASDGEVAMAVLDKIKELRARND